MIRLAAGLLLLHFGVAAIAPATAATLNTHVVVEAGVVRIGDIWTDAGKRADAVVGHAPALGERATLNTRWLRYVAKSFEVDWTPASGFEEAVVERASYEVGRPEVEARIIDELAARGLDPADLQIDLGNRPLILAASRPENATVGLADFAYNATSGRFAAVVRVPASGPAAQQIRITGRAHRLISLPVVDRRLRPGDVIRRDHIRYLRLRGSGLAGDTVTDEDTLLGMAAKRGLKADTPIRQRDIRRPLEVEKGDLLTLILRTSLMTLTAEAKALEEGSRGDVVRVLNTRSNKVVLATITGPNLATVRTNDRLAMND